MRIIAVVFLGLWLTACAVFQNPVNTTRLAAVESAYGVALSIAVAYRNTRLCKRGEAPTVTNVCAKRDVIEQLQAADRKVQIALIAARQFVRDNPTLDAFAVIQAAQQAVDIFRAIQIENGVQ